MSNCFIMQFFLRLRQRRASEGEEGLRRLARGLRGSEDGKKVEKIGK